MRYKNDPRLTQHLRPAGEFDQLMKQAFRPRGPVGEFDNFLRQPFRPSWQRPRYNNRPSGPAGMKGLVPQFRYDPFKFMRIHPALRTAMTIHDLMTMYEPSGPQVEGHYDMTGWNKICENWPGTSPAYWQRAAFNPGLSCNPTAVDVPDGLYGSTITFGVSTRWFCIGQNNDIGTVGRQGRNEQWSRPGTSPGVLPWIPPSMPPSLPRPDMWRPPEPVYKDSKPGNRDQDPRNIRRFPYQRPGIEWKFSPGSKTKPQPIRNWHNQLPVGQVFKEPTKEKKFAITETAAHRLYGLITEVDDFADSLVKGFPEGHRCRRAKGPAEKLSCFYNSFDSDDWSLSKFLGALAENQVEDWAIGKFGQASKYGLREAIKHGYYRSPVGFGTGLAL